MKKQSIIAIVLTFIMAFPLTACSECEHQVTTWETRTQATCTADGEEFGVCDLCGEEQTRPITAFGHTLQTVGAQTMTCMQDGWAEYQYCTTDGCNYSTKVLIPSEGHKFTNGIKCDTCSTLQGESQGLKIVEASTYAVVDEIGTFTGENLVIPAYYNGKPVTEISSYAFDSNETLKSVVIPDTVTEISWYAFRNCINIETVVIPSSVELIDEYAFRGCDKLTSVELLGIKEIGQWAFAHCDNLARVVIGDGTVSIGKRAFQQCYALNYLELGTGDKTIGDNAFDYNTKMVNVYNKSNLQITKLSTSNGYVGRFARMITANESELLPIVTDTNGFVYYIQNGEKHLIDYVGTETVINVPTGIVHIEEDAFADNRTITSITLPSTVKVIKQAAFNWCSSLVTLNLNEGLEYMYANMISMTHKLKSLTVPTTVKWIDGGAFNSDYIESITFADANNWNYYQYAPTKKHGTLSASQLADPAVNATNLHDQFSADWGNWELYKGNYDSVVPA